MIKKILKLALPTIIENTLQTSVGFVDTLLITSIGIFAVTGIGSANSIINVYLAIFIAVAIAVSSMVSRNIGANDYKSASLNATKGMVFIMISSLMFLIISLFFSQPILKIMGLTDVYLSGGNIYLMIVGSSAFFIASTTYFSSLLRSQGNTKTPMYIGLIMNLINIILDLLLIFGFLFIPALGIVGTAIGTVTARIIGTIILYKYVQKSDVKIDFKLLKNNHDFKDLSRLTLPAALERLVMRFGQVLYFGLIILIGEKTFAAHTITAQIEGFTYMPALGLATAASTLVGIHIGKNDFLNARKIGILSVLIGVFWMTLLGVVEFIFAPEFASLFTSDILVLTDIIKALRTDAFIQPFVAISLVITGALQGMGDTKTPLFATLIGMCLIRVLGVYIFGIYFNLGIIGVWLAIGIDLMIRSMVLMIKYQYNFKKILKEV